MARTQRVLLPDGRSTSTVLSADGLPAAPVEEFLEFMRRSAAANTVRAYAQALACWWSVLEDTGAPWDDFTLPVYIGFVDYLRTGRLPSVPMIGEQPSWLSDASVRMRTAAVLSFYRFQSAMGVETPMHVLFSSVTTSRRSRYVRELAGVATGGPRPRYRLMRSPVRRHQAPTLTPAQVDLILDLCARPSGTGWEGNLRNRLFFATLAETGGRRGEILALKHTDWVIGRGGTPYIHIVPRDDHPGGMSVKGGRERRIYISDGLERLYTDYVWELLELGLDANPDLDQWWTFVNLHRGERGQPWAESSVYEAVSRLTRRADGALPARWTPHWMRHTHATALLLAGVPPHVVMRRLGHQDIQTTLMTYGWVTEDAELKMLADWAAWTKGWRGL